MTGVGPKRDSGYPASAQGWRKSHANVAFGAGRLLCLQTKVQAADWGFCGSVGEEDGFIFLRNTVDVVPDLNLRGALGPSGQRRILPLLGVWIPCSLVLTPWRLVFAVAGVEFFRQSLVEFVGKNRAWVLCDGLVCGIHTD